MLEFPLLMKRRLAVGVIAAAAAAIAVFAGGYAFGHGKAKPATFAAAHVVPMHGATSTTPGPSADSTIPSCCSPRSASGSTSRSVARQ